MPTAVQPTVELFLGGAWTDVTAYVDSVQSPITITRGRRDEQTNLSAAEAKLRLNNRDGRFSPRNPEGAYYGQIGRNTQVRISATVGATTGTRFYGEISSWPTLWDYSEQDVWVGVTASGITRRLTQGAPPLAGPIEQYVAGRSDVVAYWPMTDVATSSVISSGLGSGYPMAIEGVSRPRLAANQDFSTSPNLPVMNSGSFRGVPNPYAGETYTTFLVSVPAAGDTNDSILYRALTTGSAYRWELRYFNTGALVLRCFDNAGASLLTSAAVGAINGVPSVIRLLFYQSGGNVVWVLNVGTWSTGATTEISGSFAGTTGVVTQVQVNADRALVNTAVGQLVQYTNDPAATYLNAYRGYAGETAGRRIERLCAAQGVAFTSVGNLDATELMGPQTAKTLLDLLGECEDADMGFLYEPRTAFGLAYRTRESLYNQAATATVPYTNLRGIEPVEDDQLTRNDITVTRTNGGSQRAVLAAGALSVQSPPNGVGRYQDTPTVNVYADTQLNDQAAWRLARGTLDEPRFPVIGIDPVYLTSVRNAVAALDVGSLLVCTATPKWVPREGVSVLTLGYTESLKPYQWELAFNCVPATLYDNVFTLDDATLGRLDATTLVTNGSLTTTATNIPYTSYGEGFITTAANPTDFPVSILIGGEQITATAATGSAITGTRSVNGVVKTQPSGAPINVATPAVLAL